MSSEQRISAVADELVRAVRLASDVSFLEGKEAAVVEAVKELRDDLKEEMSITSNSTTNINRNIDKQNEKISVLNENLEKLSTNVLEHRKMQSLEWAITNVDRVEFQNSDIFTGYYAGSYSHITQHRSAVFRSLVVKVLLAFRMNTGYLLPGLISTSLHKVEASQPTFHDDLSKVIFQLTGSEPRIVMQGPGEYMIYYS